MQSKDEFDHKIESSNSEDHAADKTAFGQSKTGLGSVMNHYSFHEPITAKNLPESLVTSLYYDANSRTAETAEAVLFRDTHRNMLFRPSSDPRCITVTIMLPHFAVQNAIDYFHVRLEISFLRAIDAECKKQKITSLPQLLVEEFSKVSAKYDPQTHPKEKDVAALFSGMKQAIKNRVMPELHESQDQQPKI